MSIKPAQTYQITGQKLLAEWSQSSSNDYLAVIEDDVEDDAGGMSNNDVLGIAFYSFLGFTIVQISYALRANSSAMIADSAAMFVDAGTYLCNMLAERLKSQTPTDDEKGLSPHDLQLRIKLQTLYLELFPPLVSVVTLLYVTVTTFKGATFTLMHRDQQEENTTDQPNLKVMMVFSAMNLLLDIVNVTCFARAQYAVLTPLNFETRNEKTPLISNIDETLASTSIETIFADDELSDTDPMNLNMCSAWTVRLFEIRSLQKENTNHDTETNTDTDTSHLRSFLSTYLQTL